MEDAARLTQAGHRILIGTQGEGPGNGVWLADFDPVTGAIGSPALAAEIERPTWLLRHPREPVVYAVSEVGNRDARDGRIHALQLADDGSLHPLNDVSAHGGGPTDLAFDGSATTLFVANFGGGQVSAIPIESSGAMGTSISQYQQTGSGPHRRQTKAHPHGVTADPANAFLLAPDMGADRVFIHPFDQAGCRIGHGEAREVSLPPGSGPRLLRFAADGRFAYLLTELSAELVVYAWNATSGALDLVQTLALDEDGSEGEPSAAAIVLSADGRHLYASNRRSHAIHLFEVNRENGLLRQIQVIPCGGERPWSATLSPDGAWLLVTNQASDRVEVFARDGASGRLRHQQAAGTGVPMPSCVIFA